MLQKFQLGFLQIQLFGSAPLIPAAKLLLVLHHGHQRQMPERPVPSSNLEQLNAGVVLICRECNGIS
jgi:hypothetical protein